MGNQKPEEKLSKPRLCPSLYLKIVHPSLFTLVFCVVLLCVFTFWVPLCCVVSYDIRIKMMFGSSLQPVVCRRAHVLFTLLCWPPLHTNKQNKNTTQHVLATTTHKQTKQKHNTTCVVVANTCCVVFLFCLFVCSGGQHMLCCVFVLFVCV
jgi:hypothetical protein